MASENDIREAVNVIKDTGNQDIIIMHCITSYPTKPEDANLEMIKTLTRQFPDCVIGYSDHTLGTTVAVCSTFYGTKCIEKHFTYDTKLTESRDHRLSLDEESFGRLVSELRIAEISKGKSMRDDFVSEAEAIKFARRSIVSTQKITKGSKITQEMLDVKRPGTGLPPKMIDKVVGSIAAIDIDEDVPIRKSDIIF